MFLKCNLPTFERAIFLANLKVLVATIRKRTIIQDTSRGFISVKSYFVESMTWVKRFILPFEKEL